MLYIPQPSLINFKMHWSHLLREQIHSLRHHIWRTLEVPRIRSLEQHDRMLVVLSFRQLDTPAIEQAWQGWKNDGDLTAKTILSHLLRDNKVSRHLGGYNGCYASWHYSVNPYLNIEFFRWYSND